MTLRFGPFSLDRGQYELRRDGELVACEPQVLEVLAYLVEHRDRVVSRDELVENIWEGRFVSDSAVSRAVKEARRALGDTGAESRWIKTVYGRGFTFVGEPSPEAPPPDERRQRDWKGRAPGRGRELMGAARRLTFREVFVRPRASLLVSVRAIIFTKPSRPRIAPMVDELLAA